METQKGPEKSLSSLFSLYVVVTSSEDLIKKMHMCDQSTCHGQNVKKPCHISLQDLWVRIRNKTEYNVVI